MTSESTLKDVTSVFDHYRVSVRQLWNTAFWPDPDFRNWESQEVFEEIAKTLFDELVLRRLDREWPMENLFKEPIPFFHLEPAFESMRMLVNRDPGVNSGVWQKETRVTAGKIELGFIEFFDWMALDYIDLRYYMANVMGGGDQPELTNHRVLIDRLDVKIFLVNDYEKNRTGS